ncbi:adenylate cyclase associated N terminal-domain-containing protein [Halteromyces radiatus]|uniref:adenylate cyclase associated N terminal-domain-containing protein n=1 Tax=Halteromyces radiatus TaxID=101107 RepID=UPI002220188A|nr:adenylate cyclase associated N terminal-domain-containing protein [Halteromyces radiatus]KAI8076828.1 adenylate cyclase associated N terminal-domain-containing protein [Halteromyces radiatus]
MSEFHSLANLIKRLEVATTRLEDLAMSSSSASAVAASSNNQTSAPPTATSSTPVAVQKHDDAINPSLEQYKKLSQEIGGAVAQQSTLVLEAIQAERDIIRISTLAQKPDMSSPVFAKIITPIQQTLTSIVEIKDKHRGDPLFNHLSTVAEAIPALGWFTFEPTPVPIIREMKDAGQFYANRVVKEYKEKDSKHVEWVQSYLAIFDRLGEYVKENYPTGLIWNGKGGKAEDYIGNTSSSNPSSTPTTTTAGGPPVPPPPPPPMIIDENESSVESKPTGAAAVFAEINRGENVTSGLRKVDKSQMTHKNPALRGNDNSPPLGKKQGPPTPNKPNKYILKKPAKTTLEANKWVVENHEGNNEIIIEDTAINQAVYIYGCKNSTIRIKGKVNAVTMDSCVKCGLALDSVVSTVDIVNCRSFGLQIFHVTPTIAVDKSDGGEIYVSKDCLGVEILSAKSSSLNVYMPESPDADDSDFKEVPVPEQFKTTIVNGKLVTSTVEHTG